MRIAAIALCLIAAALAGCGGDSSDEPVAERLCPQPGERSPEDGYREARGGRARRTVLRGRGRGRDREQVQRRGRGDRRRRSAADQREYDPSADHRRGAWTTTSSESSGSARAARPRRGAPPRIPPRPARRLGHRGRGARRAAPARARCSSRSRTRSGSLEEAEEVEDQRVGEPQGRAAIRPSAPSVGSSSSPPAIRAAATPTAIASRPHSYGTGKRRWVNDVHQHEHDDVGADQGEAGADDPERRDQGQVEADVGDGRDPGRRQVELGAAGAAEDHDQDEVERVERHPRGEQPDRLVGLEELGRGEEADDPAREQPEADDHERADGEEPGDDQRVDPLGLVVVR